MNKIYLFLEAKLAFKFLEYLNFLKWNHQNILVHFVNPASIAGPELGAALPKLLFDYFLSSMMVEERDDMLGRIQVLHKCRRGWGGLT